MTVSGNDSLAQQLEWFETAEVAAEPHEKSLEEGRASVMVARILYCPSCQWEESEAAENCYRCGAVMVRSAANDPLLLRLGITSLVPSLKRPEPESLPVKPSPLLDAEGYLMRLRDERLRLVQGFEELASLEHINLEHYDYQLDATRSVLSRMRGRALLADEVGLGKTIEAGLVMKELVVRRLGHRILILTPASLVYQWQEELRAKFSEEFEVITQAKQWDDLAERADAKVIVSLDRAKGERHAPYILKMPWDLVTIDEAHRLKNRSTVAYKFVKQIERRYMLMLTATPVHNDLTELYSLIDLLKPGQLGTIRSFREQFIKSGDPRSPENAPALKRLLSDVMIRNRRSEVGVIFPKRRAAVFNIDLPAPERALYDGVSSFIRDVLQHQVKEGKAQHLRLGLMTLQRELCSSPAAVAMTLRKISKDKSYSPELRKRIKGFATEAEGIGYAAKVDAMLDLIEKYPGKFLIFTEFRESQADLMRALAEGGISAVAFHGGLNGPKKEAAVNAFRGDVRVMVSTESGGEGRNLQFCHQLINYDLPWNPMRVEQRIGRVHRLGQKHDVLVFNLTTRDTLEAYLLELLVRKIRMFELVVGELDLILGDVDKLGENRSFEELVVNAWMSAEDEIDLQVSFDEIGSQFEQARSRYLDTRLLNEEVFDQIDLE